MLDPKLIRSKTEKVAENLTKRDSDFDLGVFLDLEESSRKIQTEIEALRSEKNKLSKQIGSSGLDQTSKQQTIEKVNKINDSLKTSESGFEKISQEVNKLSLELPNLLHESVPKGKDENDNLEIRNWGEPKEFNFEPKDHTELGEKNSLIDFESASKISGSRFVVMSNDYALLHRALIHFMLDVQTNENGYIEHYVPSIVKSESLVGTGQLPKFAEDQYKIENEEDLYLIPTAEVPLTNLVRESIIDPSQLPMKMVAHTPCYRQEAGSYGQDTRGMIRQHQFEKVELVHIVKPEESYDALEELTSNAESILVKLNLPYRVMVLCSSDTGFSAAKTYDIEVWIPSQKKYREISSCSNCESFQARRMKARYKNEDSGQNDYLHTLNGSGLAVGRTFIAILENYQNEDGSVTVPDALRKYMNNKELI